VNPNIGASHVAKDIMLEVEKLKAKYLLNAISILTSEIQELQPVIDGPFQEIGIHIPS